MTKYVVVLYDGMADYPVPALGGKTPMMCAKKPNMDFLAQRGEVGLVRTVAEGLKPGSDVANMSVMGFDPMKFYTGRSPLEAASIGIDMKKTDVSLRTNLVTLSEDDLPYEQKTIEDYCADDISTEEAEILIKYIDEKLGTDEFKFFPGVSYRHCLIWDNGTTDLGKMTPPHDITGKVITEHLSASQNAKPKKLAKADQTFLHWHRSRRLLQLTLTALNTQLQSVQTTASRQHPQQHQHLPQPEQANPLQHRSKASSTWLKTLATPL